MQTNLRPPAPDSVRLAPPAERLRIEDSSRLSPHLQWRDPAYGCVEWYGYQSADERKPATNETRT